MTQPLNDPLPIGKIVESLGVIFLRSGGIPDATYTVKKTVDRMPPDLEAGFGLDGRDRNG
jgi:hypothetical protein